MQRLLLSAAFIAAVSATALAQTSAPESSETKSSGFASGLEVRDALSTWRADHGANWLSDAGAAAGNASSLAGGGTSTWGATQLRGDDGLWHTFVDEMKQNCGIDGCASLLISQAASLQLSALRCRRSACVLELSACCLWSSQS